MRAWLVLAVLAVTPGACDPSGPHAADEHSPPAVEVGAPPSIAADTYERIERVRPYPRGRWRLASPGALSRTMVWVSHILVRHRDVLAGKDVPFTLSEWTTLPGPPERSRDEALALAREVQRSAVAEPASFERLAQQYSEDVTTRERGGSLGGIEAFQLIPWPELLDTLAALPQGRVSEVVETTYGFHIFHRRSPPPEQTVSGAHLVIGHDDAPWLHQLLARSRVPRRSREAAQALARELQARAAAEPQRFDELVERYSEHRDAAARGDIGTWSTREPTPHARELELLAELQVGEVAGPIETFTGFSIVRRTPDRPRPEYAADVIEMSFEPSFEDAEPLSRASVKKQMMALLESLAEHPERFTEYQREHCCSDVRRWRDGRGDIRPNLVVASLAIGEQYPQLIESATSWSIVRRAALPPPLAMGPLVFELPHPKATDLGALIRQGVSVQHAMAGLRHVVKGTREALELDAATAAKLSALHEIQPRLDADDARPYLTIAELFESVRALLGSAGYERYQELLNRHFEALILNGQAH